MNTKKAEWNEYLRGAWTSFGSFLLNQMEIMAWVMEWWNGERNVLVGLEQDGATTSLIKVARLLADGGCPVWLANLGVVYVQQRRI